MKIKLGILQKKDAEPLFQFETENRAFFETMVPSRGENYYKYDQFLRIMEELLSEQVDRKSHNNIGSQKVLENNGFIRQTKNKDPEFVHYVAEYNMSI